MALTGFGCPFLFLISSLRNRSGDRLPTFPASGHVAVTSIHGGAPPFRHHRGGVPPT
jgi:hypothetical protein